ncbi:MAG: transcription termination/antitermination NusG family protein [Burkholderiaceae bacterium]
MRYQLDESFESQNTDEWYVAYTRPQQESVAVAHLCQQGFQAYLPLFKVFKTPGKRTPTTNAPATYEPMFPRYCFFRPSTAKQSIATARSTRGVNSLVQFGSEFALLSSATVQLIRTREQERNQSDLARIDPLQPGCRVRFRDPSLNGLEALVQSVSAQRIMVLLEILGRPTRVKVTHNQVELA